MTAKLRVVVYNGKNSYRGHRAENTTISFITIEYTYTPSVQLPLHLEVLGCYVINIICYWYFRVLQVVFQYVDFFERKCLNTSSEEDKSNFLLSVGFGNISTPTPNLLAHKGHCMFTQCLVRLFLYDDLPPRRHLKTYYPSSGSMEAMLNKYPSGTC